VLLVYKRESFQVHLSNIIILEEFLIKSWEGGNGFGVPVPGGLFLLTPGNIHSYSAHLNFQKGAAPFVFVIH